jgi:hypothetical protein
MRTLVCSSMAALLVACSSGTGVAGQSKGAAGRDADADRGHSSFRNARRWLR